MFVILYLLQMSDPGQQTIQEIICGAQGDNDNNYESSITDESSSNESDDAQSDVSSSDCSEENGDPESSDESDDNRSLLEGPPGMMVSKNGLETWRLKPFECGGQTRAHNIAREQKGPIKMASQWCGRSPESAFKLFITEDMVSVIVTCTNAEGLLQVGQNWISTTQDEMYTFFGLLLLAGVYRAKNSSADEL